MTINKIGSWGVRISELDYFRDFAFEGVLYCVYEDLLATLELSEIRC